MDEEVLLRYYREALDYEDYRNATSSLRESAAYEKRFIFERKGLKVT